MDDVDDGRLDRAGFLLGALTAAADPGARLPGFESGLLAYCCVTSPLSPSFLICKASSRELTGESAWSRA